MPDELVVKSYILNFSSMEERDAFVLWCSKALPHCATSLQPASNRPDLIAAKVTDHDLNTMGTAPQSFKLFEDINLNPYK